MAEKDRTGGGLLLTVILAPGSGYEEFRRGVIISVACVQVAD